MSDSEPTLDSVVAQRYRLLIAYDGALFHGWQRQVEPDGGELRTVAGVVTSALQRVLQQPVELVGASRTDAGVHAKGQVAHFDAIPRVPVERLSDAINSRLPKDVEVLSGQAALPNFHAIRDAKKKQYRYRIFNSERRPLDRRHVVWHCWWSLNLDRMNDAARRLIGTHDFAGFANAGHGRASTVRTIHDCRVERGAEESTINIDVVGNGFLYNMVRIIAGTVVDAGRGQLEPSDVDRVLATQDRRQAGPTLSPEGLCLQWIEYGGSDQESDEADREATERRRGDRGSNESSERHRKLV